MGGISHRKVLTARATDGKSYKQLFKANDDLRQDAMMKWVFKEVSKMLLDHKATRQRQLHVRTYGVIPLSTGSGIIEWVAKSFPTGEWLRPAHVKNYPNPQERVKLFQKICKQMPPVMRHFFLERFDNPDEWFAKRTAVAFEAGKVLPVPEKVPFRLSRDIVDAMGITKTEGVFRRCCEFTMDALREKKDSIMTLLNRMQDAQQMTENVGNLDEASSRMKEFDGEADRALSIVEKNLSKTLSRQRPSMS
ncbi:Serine/threonine-protein kinase tel1 [Elasticomyces elasticus]|nr:Serine/threonine-protein kinase tel1 [Elasticomyces elasticus]